MALVLSRNTMSGNFASIDQANVYKKFSSMQSFRMTKHIYSILNPKIECKCMIYLKEAQFDLRHLFNRIKISTMINVFMLLAIDHHTKKRKNKFFALCIKV